MKKILNLFLIGAMLVSLALGFGACSTEETAEPGMTVKYIGGQYTLIEYVQEEGVTELTIDKTEDGKQITAIKAGAFDGNEEIKKITVSAGVTEIAEGAFKRMEALEEITLPFVGAEETNVNAARLFGYVFGTDSYDKGVSVTQNYNATGTATYYLPQTLQNVTITGGADYKVPAYAFYNCTALKSITIGDAAEIGDAAFYNCSYLTDFAVPANVTAIGDEAFVGCNRLKSISFGTDSKLETIGKAAFKGSKMTAVTLPSGLKTIGENAFAGRNIKNIVVPDGVTLIKQTAFGECRELETCILPDGCEIEQALFYFCDNLKWVVLPQSITYIDLYCFGYCSSLQSIFYKGTEQQWENVEVVETRGEKVYFYSEEKPAQNDGGYWHFDSAGNPVIW